MNGESYLSTSYNRNLPLIENGELMIEINKEHLQTGAIAIPTVYLVEAECLGASTVQASCGHEKYWTTFEQIKYHGTLSMGFYVLPLSKWQSTRGENEIVNGNQHKQQQETYYGLNQAKGINFSKQPKAGSNG
jgi:hypothetical protein